MNPPQSDALSSVPPRQTPCPPPPCSHLCSCRSGACPCMQATFNHCSLQHQGVLQSLILSLSFSFLPPSCPSAFTSQFHIRDRGSNDLRPQSCLSPGPLAHAPSVDAHAPCRPLQKHRHGLQPCVHLSSQLQGSPSSPWQAVFLVSKRLLMWTGLQIQREWIKGDSIH